MRKKNDLESWCKSTMPAPHSFSTKSALQQKRWISQSLTCVLDEQRVADWHLHEKTEVKYVEKGDFDYYQDMSELWALFAASNCQELDGRKNSIILNIGEFFSFKTLSLKYSMRKIYGLLRILLFFGNGYLQSFFLVWHFGTFRFHAEKLVEKSSTQSKHFSTEIPANIMKHFIFERKELQLRAKSRLVELVVKH